MRSLTWKLQLRTDRFSLYGNKSTFFTSRLFQFEEVKVDPTIVKETGKNTYNVKLTFGSDSYDHVEYGIISEDRLRVACGGGRYGFTHSLEWVDEQTAEKIRKF